MRFRYACLLLIIIFAFPTTGFVCATRVERMEADVAALQLQFNEIQRRINNDQTQLTEMILRADKKLEELGEAQGQTHDRVAQQNVQLALELEQERAEIAAMRNRLDIQQRNLEDLQEGVRAIMGSAASTSAGSTLILPSDQNGLFQFIEARRAANDAPAKRAAILEYLKRYPNAPQLEPLLAELITDDSNAGLDREAITQASNYLKLFPQGPSRNEVIYRMGVSGLRIGNCDLAIKSFETLSALGYADSAQQLRNARASCR
ncbi:MAG: hypothetical protein FWC40_03450 [Proteobacteria bacterium]|nr:hypothetical protein [Pseudomonadota bacterium]